MPSSPYHLFISYSRKDDKPQKPGDTKGWVTALRDEIIADHRRFSTEPLSIFFDTAEIKDMDDWKHRILKGLRESRILLVCLSPDYFKSPPCLWEWEEYLKRQVHALIGHDSVAPVYFVEAPDSDEQLNAAWAEAVSRKVVTPTDRPAWEQRWKDWRALINRYQRVDLKPWFPLGEEALRDDAIRQRIEPEPPPGSNLDDRLKWLGTSLWERIQRIQRATGVPGNLRRLNPHFIGRRVELRQLHENLALGAVGVVAVVHGLGGQGKTELATAYAYGWADCYPAGLWVLGAEGRREMLPLLGELCADLQIPLATGPDETAEDRGRRVLAELKRRSLAASDRDPDKGAACLLLLDNVSEPALLAEPQLAQIPREDWLRVVVTTREGPEKFPASRKKSLAFISVDALGEDDAARLIEDHQPDGQWPTVTAASDSAAAREIVRELGGFTLAIESVAIYLGLHPDIRPVDYLARLRAEGLTGVDALPADADVAMQMQHREKQLRLVLDQTLARLTPAERTALDYAALLPPDRIPLPWLRALVEQEHPDVLTKRPGYEDPWQTLHRRLEGLRLLTPGDHPKIVRFHRLVAAHVRSRFDGTSYQKFNSWIASLETEGFGHCGRLLEEYVRSQQPRPLNLLLCAMYADESCGLAFHAIQNLSKRQLTQLIFDLREFRQPEELARAFESINAMILAGAIPVVFWKNFDSTVGENRLAWLRMFLAAMQDGVAFSNPSIRVSPSIFVFATSRSDDLEQWISEVRPPNSEGQFPYEFRRVLGPDFVARLSAQVSLIPSAKV